MGLQPHGPGPGVDWNGLDGHLDRTAVGLGPDVVGLLDRPVRILVLAGVSPPAEGGSGQEASHQRSSGQQEPD